ncbi:MAG: hypothetical protein QHC40_01720 [Sphingobium sp.]|nr:hypothetical protein [Sphingobium sp.]
MNRLTPWAGWIGGLLGWVLSDQTGSDLAQFDCTRAHPLVMLLIGLVGAALAVAGAAFSLRAWRMAGATDQPGVGTRRFIAGTGIFAAALFLMAILFQTMASLVIPQCHA